MILSTALATLQVKKVGTSTWVALPEPAFAGITIKVEPIWASNTGRSITGKMLGDIICEKTTVEVKWPPLLFWEAGRLFSAISNAGAFFDFRYRDFAATAWKVKTVYASAMPRNLYGLAANLQRYTGITCTFIEQ